MTYSDSDFLKDLVGESNTLKELLDDHLLFYEELLPTVFLADVARILPELDFERDRVLSMLDSTLADRANPAWNLVATGFLEALEDLSFVDVVLYPSIYRVWHVSS